MNAMQPDDPTMNDTSAQGSSEETLTTCPLIEWRVEAGLSQAQAAVAVGVSRQLWAAWEARKRPITLQQATTILSALERPDRDAILLAKWGKLPLLRTKAE